MPNYDYYYKFDGAVVAAAVQLYVVVRLNTYIRYVREASSTMYAHICTYSHSA